MLFKCLREHVFRLVDLHPDLGEIRQLQRCTVFVNEGFDIKTIKDQIPLLNFQTFLWKIECLLNKVSVCVIAQFLCWY